MMREIEITKLLLDMQNTLGHIDAKISALSSDLESHSVSSGETKREVQEIQRELNRAKGALAAILSLGALGTALKMLL